MVFVPPETGQHKYDWHDYPSCAQPCLQNKADGYPWQTCHRDGGSCCPAAKPAGVRHFSVWDCVLQSCGNEAGQAQEAANIFMRECAVNGFPLGLNLTLGIPSAAGRDRFPEIYQYTDFGKATLLRLCRRWPL